MHVALRGVGGICMGPRRGETELMPCSGCIVHLSSRMQWKELLTHWVTLGVPIAGKCAYLENGS